MAFNPFAAASSSAPLLRDVFDIPEHKSQTFVLKIENATEASHLRQTLESYVVTDDIAAAMDQALGYVETGLTTGDNQGVYISGSFGSGKSHFMAVLWAILAGEPMTREIADLQPFIADHPRAVDAKLLQLKFHFLDSESIEDTLFRGFLRQIEETHPDAPLPVLHSADGLFRDANALREKMGDEAFFAALNEAKTRPAGQTLSGETVESGIDMGAFGGPSNSGRWDAHSYESAQTRAASADVDHADEDRTDDAARTAKDHTPEAKRSALVAALTETLFASYSRNSTWLPLDEGLKVITDHAKTLGYDGVVLFLDELILWLTFMITNQAKFDKEAQKLTLLVENNIGTFAVPLISFIARQHSLSFWQGATAEVGKAMERRRQSLAHQEGRFHNLELPSRNLPKIAHRRLLTPKPGQEVVLDRAFHDMELRPEITNVLLDGVNTTDSHLASTMDAFKLTYPFSPALVDTLVHLSPAMQRERTALTVMEALLVEHRDTMTIDRIIPVGDAFDRIITSDTGVQSRTETALVKRFRSGRKFWNEKLKPLIYKQAGIDTSTPEEELPQDTLGKLRLGKTLVMSALAPEVPALKAITASRLVHLNHGSMVEVFQGDAVSSALAAVRSWAVEFPEIIISPDSKDPVITLKLDEVPWEEVLAQAASADTTIRRHSRIRGMLESFLGLSEVQPETDGAQSRTVTWRGTPRTVEVLFGNVRDTADISDGDFHPTRSSALRLIVDLPFDDGNHTPADDHRRVENLPVSTNPPFSIVWLPMFFTDEEMARLGELVVIDHVLSNSGWRDATARLSDDVQTQVRAVITQRQQTLEQQLQSRLAAVYGAASGVTFPEGQDPLRPLDPAIDVNKPVGTTMAEAVDRLISQAFDLKYPDHPKFASERPLKAKDFDRVLTVLRAASSSRNHRADLNQDSTQAVHNILRPLGFANVQDAHIVFNADTVGSTFTGIDARLRAAGVDLDGPVTLTAVRNAVRAEMPRHGLSDLTVDLYAGAWVTYTHRSWYHRGSRIDAPSIADFDDFMELRPVALPDEDTWKTAVHVAQHLFGLLLADHRNGDNLTSFQHQVAKEVEEVRASAQALATETATIGTALGLSGDSQRALLATKISRLLDSLHSLRNDAVGMVNRLAEAETAPGRILGASPTEATKALDTSADVVEALRRLKNAGGIEQIRTLSTFATENDNSADAQRRELAREARAALDDLKDGLRAHEFATPARQSVKEFTERVSAWMSRLAGLSVEPTPNPGPEGGDGSDQKDTGRTGASVVFDDISNATEVSAKIVELISGGHRVRVTIEVIESDDGAGR